MIIGEQKNKLINYVQVLKAIFKNNYIASIK